MILTLNCDEFKTFAGAGATVKSLSGPVLHSGMEELTKTIR